MFACICKGFEHGKGRERNINQIKKEGKAIPVTGRGGH
jgi:hypothetical protein